MSMTKKSVWDVCQINPQLLRDLDEFEALCRNDFQVSTSDTIVAKENNSGEVAKVGNVDGFQHGLSKAEESGRTTLESLDNVTRLIHQMRSAYDDVTGRTNTLVSKCESLLDQQVLKLYLAQPKD